MMLDYWLAVTKGSSVYLYGIRKLSSEWGKYLTLAFVLWCCLFLFFYSLSWIIFISWNNLFESLKYSSCAEGWNIYYNPSKYIFRRVQSKGLYYGILQNVEIISRQNANRIITHCQRHRIFMLSSFFLENPPYNHNIPTPPKNFFAKHNLCSHFIPVSRVAEKYLRNDVNNLGTCCRHH